MPRSPRPKTEGMPVGELLSSPSPHAQWHLPGEALIAPLRSSLSGESGGGSLLLVTVVPTTTSHFNCGGGGTHLINGDLCAAVGSVSRPGDKLLQLSFQWNCNWCVPLGMPPGSERSATYSLSILFIHGKPLTLPSRFRTANWRVPRDMPRTGRDDPITTKIMCQKLTFNPIYFP